LLSEDCDAKRVWIEELHRARTGQKKEQPRPDLNQSKLSPPDIEESSAGIGSTDWGALLSSESDNEGTSEDAPLPSAVSTLSESTSMSRTAYRDRNAVSVAGFDKLLCGSAVAPAANCTDYQEEMRMDPEDGEMYSQQDFIDQ